MRERIIDTDGNRLGWRLAIAFALGGLGLAIGGCAQETEILAGARWQFAKQISCPEDRVTANVDPQSAAQDARPPPPEVAADPDRLAMYDKQAEAEAVLGRWVVVTGCGQEARYHCEIGHGPTGQGRWDVYCAPQLGGKLVELQRLLVERLASTPRAGQPSSARLGVAVNARTITLVVPGGIGDRAGFRVGDVVVAQDHQPIIDDADYARRTSDTSAPHVLTVQRGGTEVDISVPAH